MMQVGRAQGMVSLNDALAELVKKGLVTPEEAVLRAVDKTGMNAAQARAKSGPRPAARDEDGQPRLERESRARGRAPAD